MNTNAQKTSIQMLVHFLGPLPQVWCLHENVEKETNIDNLILFCLSLSGSACVLRKYQVMHSYLSFFIRHKQCIVTWMYQLARSWSYTSSWWWSLLQWTQFHLRLRPHTLLNFKQRLRLLMMLGVIAMFPWQFLIRWDLTYWKQDNFYVSSQSMI